MNATYGLAIAIGLSLIGLPYAMMWGTMAFFVRFIPYVGPWLGAILPVAFSVVFFDGWGQPLMVMGLFTTMKLLSNMIMEPMLYGQSAGVSEVALLVALALWTCHEPRRGAQSTHAPDADRRERCARPGTGSNRGSQLKATRVR